MRRTIIRNARGELYLSLIVSMLLSGILFSNSNLTVYDQVTTMWKPVEFS